MALTRRSFLAFPFTYPLAFDREGRVSRSEQRTAQGFADALPHAGGALEMVELAGGTMRAANGRTRLVSPFALGRYEVTVRQWNAVARMGKRKRTMRVLETGKKSPFGWEEEQAVEMVGYDDCEEFCARVARHTGRAYRLPTALEWEYACRGGTETRFWWGDLFSKEVAVALGDGAPKRPGSTGFANGFGIYDIVGNVDEWVAPGGKERDRFHLYHSSATESDWLSEQFVRNGLGFRVAAS